MQSEAERLHFAAAAAKLYGRRLVLFFSEDERDAAWMCVIERSDERCIGGKSLVGEVPVFGMRYYNSVRGAREDLRHFFLEFAVLTGSVWRSAKADFESRENAFWTSLTSKMLPGRTAGVYSCEQVGLHRSKYCGEFEEGMCCCCFSDCSSCLFVCLFYFFENNEGKMDEERFLLMWVGMRIGVDIVRLFSRDILLVERRRRKERSHRFFVNTFLLN